MIITSAQSSAEPVHWLCDTHWMHTGAVIHTGCTLSP
uniref:Uncharacterized protein n=1 Tax=Anguilla anguilla TaxID=7936 RepID=A0A0E9V8Q1_ANGAN